MGRISKRVGAATLVMGTAVALLTGCAAQAQSATPTGPATPSVSRSPVPDVSIRRTVALADGTTKTICVTASANRDTATEDSHTDERLRQARAILTDPKWQTYPVSLSGVPADEQAQDRAKGEDDAVLLAGALSDAISDAVRAAGLLGEGVSLGGHVGCE